MELCRRIKNRIRICAFKERRVLYILFSSIFSVHTHCADRSKSTDTDSVVVYINMNWTFFLLSEKFWEWAKYKLFYSKPVNCQNEFKRLSLLTSTYVTHICLFWFTFFFLCLGLYNTFSRDISWCRQVPCWSVSSHCFTSCRQFQSLSRNVWTTIFL